MSFTLSSAQRWWARETPDALAVSVDGRSITFGDLYRWQLGIAAWLETQAIGQGDRVGVIAVNSLDYCALILGLIERGAICVPLNFRATRSEIADFMGAAGVTALFADEPRRTTVEAAAQALPGCAVHGLEALGEVARPERLPLRDDKRPDDVVAIISTSGSTAKPKGVTFTHGTILTYACEFALTEPSCARGGSVMCIPPLSSASGYLMLVQFNAAGAGVFLETVFEPETALRRIVEHGITAFQGVPTFFERIAALPSFAATDLSCLKFAQVGGARVSPQLQAQWLEKGVVLRNLFGQTEAGGGWAARDDVALTEPTKCGRGGIFTDFVVLDGDAVAEPGAPGEIGIRGPTVTPGYWENPDANEAAFRGGWLRTGDLGVMDGDGNLTFIDRLKDIIISGGLNISAAEVEAAVAEVPGVTEVAVIATRDEKFGETPLAVVHGDGRATPEAIVAHCNERLSNYKVPRYIAIEAEPLPRLSNGKLDKLAIRARHQEGWQHLPRVR